MIVRMVVFVVGFTLATFTTAPAHAQPETSCYGPGFWGRPTASGITLYPSTIGVAHKTLPLGTRLRVRSGGATITVRVIDRGPYAKGRILDLTEAAARALGYRNCDVFGHRVTRSWRAR